MRVVLKESEHSYLAQYHLKPRLLPLDLVHIVSQSSDFLISVPLAHSANFQSMELQSIYLFPIQLWLWHNVDAPTSHLLSLLINCCMVDFKRTRQIIIRLILRRVFLFACQNHCPSKFLQLKSKMFMGAFELFTDPRFSNYVHIVLLCGYQS